MTQRLKVDSDAVRSLAELLTETGLTEIEYQVDSLKIRVLRSVQQEVISMQAANHNTMAVPSQNSNAGALAAMEISVSLEKHPGVIEAQMVGTVYLSPGPAAGPFISVGDKISQGQTLFIIEAMKVMNMVKSPRSGVIKHIFVRDAQPVEYGDPIVIVE
ncbi:MAG: acetyl-CoA carboxylase, biotin carboxyl carrier protein [Holosporaceae bacterium]|nr:acetyl-CoA carboxylase, biotin carboxyl carrier protein [Holosporaceae bacterium]